MVVETGAIHKQQNKPQVVRRGYSRNGCLPCKQRRHKCDEQKPQCSNCLVNKTECSYKTLLKFTDSRSFTLDGSKLGNIKSSGTSSKNDKIQKIKQQDTHAPKHFAAKPTKRIPINKPMVDPFSDQLPQVVENHNQPVKPAMPNVSSTNMDLPSQNSYYPDLPVLDFMASNQNTQEKNGPALTQIELENSLFDGASNLITDLNSLINSFEVNFSPLEIQSQGMNSFSQSLENNNSAYLNNNVSANPSPAFTAPALSDLRFEGISPTNYSVDSHSVAADNSSRGTPSIDQNLNNYSDDDDDEGNPTTPQNRYIETLTKSLAHYRTPKTEPIHVPHMKSPISSKEVPNDVSKKLIFGTNSLGGFRSEKAFPPPVKDMLVSFDYIEMLNRSISEDTIATVASFFNWPLNSSHAKYINVFVKHIHLNIIPFSTSHIHNAYINIFLNQAKDAPHLLFAILAISARFEAYQIEQHPESHNYTERLKYHNSFRTYYLSSCLKALESILHTKQTTLNNIESLLLTIQVLASDFSGHKGSQWRTHLHGAKDMLVKYCRYRPLSQELTIVWLWFHSMEVLAALTSPNGGTIHNFNEMDEFLPVLCPQYPQYLKDLGKHDNRYQNPENKLLEPGRLTGMLIYMGIGIPGTLAENGLSRFNMYLGYDEVMLEVFNILVYGIECLRKESNRLGGHSDQTKVVDEENTAIDNDNQDHDVYDSYRSKILDQDGRTFNSTYFLTLCGLIKKARSFQYINNAPPYIIPLTSELHPSNILKALALEEEEEKYSKILDKITISTYIRPKQSDTMKKTFKHSNLAKSSIREKQQSLLDLADQTKGELYFSWIDLAQQLNVDAAFLRLLTLHGGIQPNGLNIKTPMIQDVVKRMVMGLYGLVRFREEVAEDIDDNKNNKLGKLDLLHERYDKKDESGDQITWPKFAFDQYLNYQFDNRIVMVQWPLYVCGLCCIEPEHKAIIECCFFGLIGLGVGSGELSLKKLQKIWALQKQGEFCYDSYNLFGQGFQESDEDDYVPFM